MGIIPNRDAPHEFPEAYLERVYPMPRPLDWLHEWERLHHHDLEALDDSVLLREHRRVQRRLDDDPDACRREWLARRLAAVERERQSRRPQVMPERPPRRVAASEPSRKSSPGHSVVTVAGQTIDLPASGGRHGHE